MFNVQQLNDPHNIRGPKYTYGLRAPDIVRMQLNRRYRLKPCMVLSSQASSYLVLSMFAKCSFLMT